MKKIISLLCMAACIFSLAACSADEAKSSAASYDETIYKTGVDNILQSLSEFSEEDIESVLSASQYYDPGDVALITAWKNVYEEVGSYIGVSEWKFNATEKEVEVVATVDYSDRDATVRVAFTQDGNISSCSINPIYTRGELMGKAGLNTLIGIGVVFIVLILISLLISCFSLINKAEQAIKNRKENKVAVAAAGMDNTIAQIVQKEEEELVDDLELVAVISAAVAAYTGSSTDGFVVRSIKKSNKKRWQSA